MVCAQLLAFIPFPVLGLSAHRSRVGLAFLKNLAMKTFLLVLGGMLAFAPAFAQSYDLVQRTGSSQTDNFQGQFDAILLTGSQDDVLSDWQPLPFEFNFFGEPVSGYFASDNGYITFDPNATVSYNAPSALPQAAGPNLAVYAFWHDFYLNGNSSAQDVVYANTWGKAPNRVHAVTWRSVASYQTSGSYYFSLRLYECGGIEVGLYQGNNADGVIGVENGQGTEAVVAAGSGMASFGSSDIFLQGDDRLFGFQPAGLELDLSLQGIDLPLYLSESQQQANFLLKNQGQSAIQSFELHYGFEGGPVQTAIVEGINLPALGSMAFAPGQLLETGAAGHKTVVAHIEKVNGMAQADGQSCNNEASLNVAVGQGSGQVPKVLIEEFSGAWCGACIFGKLILDDIRTSFGDQVEIISVHHADAMDFPEGLRVAYNIFAFPQAIINRRPYDGAIPLQRDSWGSAVEAARQVPSPAQVAVSYQVNESARTLDIALQTTFTDYGAGDFRMVPMVLEDGVTGTGSGYDQVNFSDEYGGVSPIVGYVHDNVLRALPSGPFGVPGAIPGAVSPGEVYTQTFSYAIPQDFDMANIRAAGALINVNSSNLSRPVISAAEVVDVISTVETPDKVRSTVYPNPVTEGTFWVERADSSGPAILQVYSLSGQLAYEQAIEGRRSQVILPYALSGGLYLYRIASQKGELLGAGKILLHR